MERYNELPQASAKHVHNVHRVLAHSYSLHFVLFLIGITLDLVFRLRIFTSPAMRPVGIVFLVSGTLLIFWAQKTSRNLHKGEMSHKSFLRGPYCYTRSPTHWGIFLMMVGFGILVNALFVVLTTIISFLVAKFVFQNKEEEILAAKYGEHYRQYKRLVRF